MKQKAITIGKQILQKEKFFLPTPYCLPIKKARKNRIYDYDRNTYIDFYLHRGSILLGYKPQQLSTQLNNRLSMGFFSGFSHHLVYRAKTTIQEFFSSKNLCLRHNILFFHSQKEQNQFLNSLSLPEISPLCFSQWDSIMPEQIVALDFTISNGYPIYTLLLPQAYSVESYHTPLDISPLAYQSIITTLPILQKKDLSSHMQKLTQPFLSYILHRQGHFFKIKTLNEDWKLVSKQLFKLGIIVDPQNPTLYICLETTPQDIQYFFSILKKVLE